MHLYLNEDQIMLRDTIARLFQTEVSSESLRAAEQSNGFDQSLWSQLVELGFHSMRITEASGGMAMSLLDAAIVTEEQGRAIAPVPLCEAIAANRVLSLLGDSGSEVAEDLCAQAMANEKLISFLPVECGNDPMLMPWSAIVDGIVALQGEQILLIQPTTTAVTKNMGAAGHHLIALADCSYSVIAEGTAARQHFLATIEEWKLLTAASLAGLSRQSLDMAVAYACEREQFGRLIGGYQGIAHPLASKLADAEGMQLLVWYSIWAIANKAEDYQASSAMAYWWATQAAPRLGATCLHTFGGYGVSLEYDIQLYYRRAKAWSLMAGNPQNSLKQVGERLWLNTSIIMPDVGTIELDFSLGENADAMAQEVRDFFEVNLTDDLRAKAHHSVSGYDEAFSQKLCAAGLRYPHWPKEYGGREATPYDMAALNRVFEDYGWERITGPVTNQIAFGVMEFAGQDVKDEILGKFSRGDALGCLGFSEPASGSDIYAAKTSAVRDGDEWVINGQKIFTTSGNLAKYMFLLARTDPDAPKHKGITIFIMPMDADGVEIQPVHTLQDELTNITYIENVRIPDKYRLGEVNGGIKVMLHAMEMEHGGADQYRLNYASMLEGAITWAKTTEREGDLVINNNDARLSLAKTAIHHAVSKVLCYRSLWASYVKAPGRSHFGPVSKLFTTEAYLASSIELTDLAAPFVLFEDKHGVGHVELGYRQSIGTTIYGGTSEIMRSIIAEHGLGLPKSRS